MEGDSLKGRSSRKTKAQLSEENDSLRQSEARFRTLADLAPVVIYHTDAQGLITYFNQRISEFGGLSSEQAMGAGWIASVHPEDRERIAAEWNQAVRNKRTFRAEYRFMHPEGMVTWCYDQAVAETDADGKPTGWVGCFTVNAGVKVHHWPA